MPTDDAQPDTEGMLPDEAAVIAERADSLDELDDGDYFSTEDVADSLGIGLNA